MKYKVGDKVRIKSLDWYNENKDKYGIVELSTHVFIPEMSEFCGKVVTIKDIFEDINDNVMYYMDGIDYDWTDEMIEGLVEEKNIDIDDFQDDNEIIDVIDEYVHRLKNNECQINLPEGYQFTDENGNVINTHKIVLKKKKKEYPKTYEECLKVLGFNVTHKVKESPIFDYDNDIVALQRLKRCRDAYWKLYGEEMGLGKPWKPIDNSEVCYGIFTWAGEIQHDTTAKWCILTFPTAEMRDAFYENFKELIEQCKELL